MCLMDSSILDRESSRTPDTYRTRRATPQRQPAAIPTKSLDACPVSVKQTPLPTPDIKRHPLITLCRKGNCL